MTLPADPVFRAIGPASILPPPGGVVGVQLEGGEIVIANVRGRYHALDGLCEHAGYPLAAGRLIGCMLTCPLHGWTYDVTDGWISDPPLGRRTRSYTVRVTNGTVEIAPAA